MKQSPIIGVTPLWDAERKSIWMLPDYLDGIRAAGGIPVVLPLFINVFLGGTLWQDLPSQHPSEIVHRQGKPYGTPTHKVMLSGDLSTLLGKETLEVNTLHHQAAKDLGENLEIMAVAPDGIIEAVQMAGKRFVWAVQWHPEYMFRTDPDSLAIFLCFVKHCK